MTKNAFLGIGAVALVIILALLLTAGSWLWRYQTAPIRGKVGAEERIESAPSRISNYDHYYDLCATVQATEGALDAQMQALEAAESSDDRSRIRSNIAGLKGQRSRQIAQYNADARKIYTKARFRASDLPPRINADEKNTTCR